MRPMRDILIRVGYFLSGADVATAALVSVKVVKVSHDDRHRQSNGKHPCNHTQRANKLAPDSDRCDVAVANGRHGYDGPPECARYRRELRLLLADLGVVRGWAEDHHGNEQRYRHGNHAVTIWQPVKITMATSRKKKNMPSSWRLVLIVSPRIRRPCTTATGYTRWLDNSASFSCWIFWWE